MAFQQLLMLSKGVLSWSLVLLIKAESWQWPKPLADGDLGKHESSINVLMMPVAAPMCSWLMHECVGFAREIDDKNYDYLRLVCDRSCRALPQKQFC